MPARSFTGPMSAVAEAGMAPSYNVRDTTARDGLIGVHREKNNPRPNRHPDTHNHPAGVSTVEFDRFSPLALTHSSTTRRKGKETATVGRRGEHFHHLVGGISRVGTFEPCDDAPEPGQVVCYGGLHGEQAAAAANVGTKVLVRTGKPVTPEAENAADWVLNSLADLPQAIKKQQKPA